MNKKTYLTLLSLLLINFVCLFMIVFKIENYIIDFFISIVFFITAIILVYSFYKGKFWANQLARLFFAASLINAAFLFRSLPAELLYLGLVLLIVNLTGFSYFILDRKTKVIRKIKLVDLPKTISIVEEPMPSVDEYKQITKSQVNRTFKPGKFIASKTGVKYHIPKCIWAKKINSKNRVWLKDSAEAKKKGYKKCSCVK